MRHRALCHARQRRGGGRERFSGVVEQPSDVRANLGSSSRRCCRGQAALCSVCCLSWLASGGESRAECAEIGKMMAPMAATLGDDAAIDNVVAYIRTLPDNPASPTVKRNATNGQRIYVTCGACHGADGRGLQATNAPRLKGMSDWYMFTQLRNFKQGVRGAHPKDLYGPQMALMAAILADDQATHDVVAYINTLR
ncbi:MAG: cytochrome C [Acidobacteria bacterium]|nr:MAG: cytochrome C [Acidobacteriota bacterium]